MVPVNYRQFTGLDGDTHPAPVPYKLCSNWWTGRERTRITGPVHHKITGTVYSPSNEVRGGVTVMYDDGTGASTWWAWPLARGLLQFDADVLVLAQVAED